MGVCCSSENKNYVKKPKGAAEKLAWKIESREDYRKQHAKQFNDACKGSKRLQILLGEGGKTEWSV